MRKKQSNPVWTDKLLDKYQDQIEARATELGLPIPIRGSGVYYTPHEYTPLGCGAFGCVFDTDNSEIVFKITTDGSEVVLIKNLEKLNLNNGTGIVKYYAVFGTADTVRQKDVTGIKKDRTVYFIWRKKVDFPSVEKFNEYLESEYSDNTEEDKSEMAVFDLTLESLYMHSKNFEDSFWMNYGRSTVDNFDFKKVFNIAQKPNELLARYDPDSGFKQVPMAKGKFTQLQWSLAAYVNLAVELSLNKYGENLGRSLLELAEEGIILCDLHSDNVGYLSQSDQFVVHDPGLVINLRTKFDTVTIEKI